MRNINLLIISSGCAPDKIGQSLRVFNWIKMVKGKINVSLLSTYQKENPRIADKFYYQTFPDSWISKIKKLWTFYKTDFKNLQAVEKPDIVQIHTPYFIGLKKMFPKTPIVFVEHDVNWNLIKYDMEKGPGIEKLPIKFPLVPWLKWRAKEYEKKALTEVDYIFVCSPLDKKEILKELPDLSSKISVVPNSLDLSLYPPSEKVGNSVLFMGSLTYSANLEAIDIICREIAPYLPEIPFKILGSGRYSKPHPGNVEFLGHVPDIKPHIADCRLFIVPLLSGSGTRWKILEAMAMQRPVLSTPKGAEGLEVTNDENIIIEEKGFKFVEAIKRIWNNPEEVVMIAKNGRELIKNTYNLYNYETEVIDIYQKLLK